MDSWFDRYYPPSSWFTASSRPASGRSMWGQTWPSSSSPFNGSGLNSQDIDDTINRITKHLGKLDHSYTEHQPPRSRIIPIEGSEGGDLDSPRYQSGRRGPLDSRLSRFPPIPSSVSPIDAAPMSSRPSEPSSASPISQSDGFDEDEFDSMFNEEEELEMMRQARASQGDQDSKAVVSDASETADAVAAMARQSLPPSEYHGIRLTKDDLQTLAGPYFVNDDVITFYFEYLQNEMFSKRQSVLFVPPSLAYLIAHTQSSSDLKEQMLPLQLHTRDVIFFPLNDNSNPNSQGGSHWALLVFTRGKSEHGERDHFRYFDSRGTGLYDQAKEASLRLVDFCNCVDPVITVESTPQQVNDYDCGIYVLALCHFICDMYFNEDERSVLMSAQKLPEWEMERIITPRNVADYRRQIFVVAKRLFPSLSS